MSEDTVLGKYFIVLLQACFCVDVSLARCIGHLLKCPQLHSICDLERVRSQMQRSWSSGERDSYVTVSLSLLATF